MVGWIFGGLLVALNLLFWWPVIFREREGDIFMKAAVAVVLMYMLLIAAFWGAVIFVAVHFITKYW